VFCLFVCLFVEINPENLYSVSCVGREVNLLGVITQSHGQRLKPRVYFEGWRDFLSLVFGLLCHHTASNSITAEMHTSGV